MATSPLVKTALFGGDANWGRILAAVGRAGVPLEIGRIGLIINGGEDATQRLGALQAKLEADPAYAVAAAPAAAVRRNRRRLIEWRGTVIRQRPRCR